MLSPEDVTADGGGPIVVLLVLILSSSVARGSAPGCGPKGGAGDSRRAGVESADKAWLYWDAPVAPD